MLIPSVHGSRYMVAGGVWPVTISYSAICESGYTSTGAPATNATVAFGWKPTVVDPSYPLCDVTGHYLVTVSKSGTTVTVYAQDQTVGSYTTSATTYAGLVAEAMTQYAGDSKGYFSRLAIVESALTYTSFYQASDTVSGLWVPKSIGGLTLHTLLDFSNSGSLGADSSGNGNNWTLTSAVQSIDTPTNNFATWNPLRPSVNKAVEVFSDGNLKWGLNGANNYPMASWYGMRGGKFYYEIEMTVSGSTNYVGITDDPNRYAQGNYPGSYSESYGFRTDTGATFASGVAGVTIGTASTNGDIVQLYVDLDNGAVWIGINGTLQNGATIGEIESGNTANAVFTGVTDKTFYPAVQLTNTKYATADFGQNGFSYSAPTGWLTLSNSKMVDSEYDLSGSYIGNNSAAGPYEDCGCALQTVTIDGTTYDNDGTDAADIVFTAAGFKRTSTVKNTVATWNWTGTLKYAAKYSNAQVN